MRRIAILGSTGSIGTQALEVISRHPDKFTVTALTAHSSCEALFEQVRRFRPAMAGLAIEPDGIPEDVRFCDWRFGKDCLTAAAEAPSDSVLAAVVGFAGIDGVLAALGAGRTVLLANKEPLVAAGALVSETALRTGANLLPVDSEHSAIFQCLQGAAGNTPDRLCLTASGGPFRTWSPEKIADASAEQALAHPNWSMGRKITVDSASMMNKALEIIEARWLFGMPPERIEVLIHPQSVIHSMVQFADGAIIAQLGMPDMRLPIQYALAYPERLPAAGEKLDPASLSALTFERPDAIKFPALRLAYAALAAGGTAPAALNAANETAVHAFLAGRIRFGRITEIVEETLNRVHVSRADTLEEVREADRQARMYAEGGI